MKILFDAHCIHSALASIGRYTYKLGIRLFKFNGIKKMRYLNYHWIGVNKITQLINRGQEIFFIIKKMISFFLRIIMGQHNYLQHFPTS
jgi:hypothetical protein